MHWENSDSISEADNNSETKSFEKNLTSQAIHIQNEQKDLNQLHKYQDPGKDGQRNFYISTASKLGDFIINRSLETDLESLLTGDFEAFLFNFGEICPVQYASNRSAFIDFYNEVQVIERQVKEVNVDIDNTTVFQICYCEIRDSKEDKISPQFSFEIFTFRNDKICKYRASFACPGSFSEHRHPFIPSKKDLMLAKIKQINYAWANQPDLERIASLLDESIEYKIWRWKDHKLFTFSKSDFAAKFRNLEENYTIKSVVPYEVYSEGQYILSNYVFHLQGKHELIGKKFMWLSTCIYKFEKDFSIAKVSQQGKFCTEDAMVIPFASVFKKELEERILITNTGEKMRADYSSIGTKDMIFSFEASRFGPKNFWSIDSFRGFNEYEKLSKVLEDKTRKFEWEKYPDFYVDFQDPSYSVAFSIGCYKGVITKEDYKYSERDMNFYVARKFYIENGKLAKVTTFHSEIPEPISSPYDDKTFTAQNILCKE